MKHILLLFIIVLTAINSQAQRIAPTILLQDGTVVDSSHFFLDGEMPSFYVENDQYEDLSWSFSYYDKSGEQNILIKSERGINPFTFKIAKSLFAGSNYVRDSQKIVYSNDSSTYMRCSVNLHQNDVIINSVPILLNVLPSHARVKKATISGNFDFEEGGYNPLADLTVLFSADRINECRIIVYVPDSFNVFQFPKSFTGAIIPVDIEKKGEDLYEFKIEEVDWGQFFTLVTYNEYGAIVGDTIFTNSLIEDPEIVEYLETIHGRLTDVDEIQDDKVEVSFKKNTLIIESSLNTQIQSELYRADGTIIKSFSSKTIDLSDLCRGIYIVKLKTNNKIITKKIVKR